MAVPTRRSYLAFATLAEWEHLLHVLRDSNRRPNEASRRMQVHQSLPAAMMIQKEWSADRIGITDVAVVCRGVNKAAVLVDRDAVCERQDVVCPLDRACEKRDAETGSFPRLAAGQPSVEQCVLVRLVDPQFGADAVRGIRVERLGALIEFKRDVKRPTTVDKTDEGIGLHLFRS